LASALVKSILNFLRKLILKINIISAYMQFL